MKKRHRSTWLVLRAPMVEWSEAIDARNHDQLRTLEHESTGLAVQAARLAAYTAARNEGRTHAQAVKRQNTIAAKLRRALGFYNGRADITF